MNENIEGQELLIAPCGMNCGICSSYLAMTNSLNEKGVKIRYCEGCRPKDKKCGFIISKCPRLKKKEIDYCYQCDDFPCELLERLDARYRKSYRMSMIDNQKTIRDEGMSSFLKKEKQKWQCPDCGGIISCHNGICYSCHYEDLVKKKQIHRWE